MGHRVLNHPFCGNIHGHNWQCKITVDGKQDKNSYDFVMDYSDLKQIFNEFIHKPLDHAFIVYSQDDFRHYLVENIQKHLIVDFETNSENIAKFIFRQINREVQKLTNNRCKVTRVKIYETPTSEAVYYGEEE